PTKKPSLRLERLEERAMFAGDIDIDKQGVVTITGGDYEDVAAVSFDKKFVYVRLDRDLNAAGTRTDTETDKFQISKVTKIVFNGNGSGDTLTVNAAPQNVSLGRMTLGFNGHKGNDTLNNNSSLPTVADGGDDNDTLNGGSSGDTIYGGVGNDKISGF